MTIDWTGLIEPSDRRGLAVLEGRFGDRLRWLIRRCAEDSALADWERTMDLSLELEDMWSTYLEEMRGDHGAQGLRRLELTDSPDWHRVATHLIDAHRPGVAFRERSYSPAVDWALRLLGK